MLIFGTYNRYALQNVEKPLIQLNFKGEKTRQKHWDYEFLNNFLTESFHHVYH